MLRLWMTLCVVASIASIGISQQPRKVKINGYVYDAARTGVPGVDVTVWVAGRNDSIAGTRTERDGKYSLEVMVTDSFDIAYTTSKHHLSVVNHLAEKNDQQISRVLYVKGMKMPASAAHTYIQSVNRVVFLASSLPKDKRKEFFTKFPEVTAPLPIDHSKLFTIMESNTDTTDLLNAEWKASATSLNKLIFGK